MGMFDLTAATGQKEGGNYLNPGIHVGKFKGVKLGTVTSQQRGETYNVMELTMELDDYGEYVQRFFEPTSNERSESNFGPNPSSVEQFMCAVGQILDAVDPEIGKKLSANNITVNGKKVDVSSLDFKKLVKLVEYLTTPYIDTELELKLIPQQNGFAAVPGFPAKLNKAGVVVIASRFIGHNLVLNQSEQKKVNDAKNAQPTNMKQTSTGSTEGLAKELGIPDNDDSDLPF